MNKIVFNIGCMDGTCELVATWDETSLHYEFVTNIEYLESKTSDIDSTEFNKAIEKVGIHKWKQTYKLKDTNIENPVLWKLTYVNKTEVSYIEGIEGDWPYTYDDFIEALMLIDNKLIMFKANKK